MPHSPHRPLELDMVPGYAGYVNGVAGTVYNEAAFRHFVRIELRRAARSSHCLLLVLVDLRDASGCRTALTPFAASRIFTVLGSSVREVDFVGWFRDERVAAAALIQRATPPLETRQQIASRLMLKMSRERIFTSGIPRVRVLPMRGKR